jgi:hypothetical protein
MMNGMVEILNDKQRFLTGRVATDIEISEIKRWFGNLLSLESLLEILTKYKIIGHYFTLLESEDCSGMGVEMQWMTPKDQIEEAYDFYPGIIVSKHNYIPIGTCLNGSGDPYFLKIDLNGDWNLYRVLHDFVLDNIYNEEKAEFVISLGGLFSNID